MSEALARTNMVTRSRSSLHANGKPVVKTATPNCQSRGAFSILCQYLWGWLFGKSLHLQRLVAEL